MVAEIMENIKESIRGIDKEIGKKVRKARLETNISMLELGKHIGISGQQMHKYETGLNRLSMGKIYFIAKKLNKHISYFCLDDRFKQRNELVVI